VSSGNYCWTLDNADDDADDDVDDSVYLYMVQVQLSEGNMNLYDCLTQADKREATSKSWENCGANTIRRGRIKMFTDFDFNQSNFRHRL